MNEMNSHAFDEIQLDATYGIVARLIIHGNKPAGPSYTLHRHHVASITGIILDLFPKSLYRFRKVRVFVISYGRFRRVHFEMNVTNETFTTTTTAAAADGSGSNKDILLIIAAVAMAVATVVLVLLVWSIARVVASF